MHSSRHNDKKLAGEHYVYVFFPKAGTVLYFGIYLGTGRRCILAGRRGCLVAHITGASGDVPISAAVFWSLDYLIFMHITFSASACSPRSGLSTVHTVGSIGPYWARR